MVFISEILWLGVKASLKIHADKAAPAAPTAPQSTVCMLLSMFKIL
jgi:hypothetical protein